VKRKSALTLFAVVGMVAAVVLGIVRTCSDGVSQVAFAGQSSESVKVMDESGSAIDLMPLLAQRRGEPRKIDTSGAWSMTRLGYSDLVFPCTERFEAIQMEYVLPEDAAQGPDKLYAMALRFRIKLSAHSENGTVEIAALTNGARCAAQSLETKKSDGTLTVNWTDKDGVPKSTSSLAVDVDTSACLRDAHLWFTGVKPGLNTLTIRLSQYEGISVESLRVSRNSGIQVIEASSSNGADILNKLPRLSSSDESKARTIALADERIRELVQGKDYEITLTTPQDWGVVGTGDTRVDIRFKVAHQVEYDWPWPPPPAGTKPLSGNFWVRTLTIAIDLEREIVVGISPIHQPIALESVQGVGTQTLTEEEKGEAESIALADPTVKALLAGKQYKVGQRYDDFAPDTRIGALYDENMKKTGAALEIWFDRAYTITDWDSLKSDSSTGAYVDAPLRTTAVRGIQVCINQKDAKVDCIVPLY